MRLLLSVLLAVALVTAAGLGVNRQLGMATDRLVAQIDRISAAIEQDDWDGAAGETDRLIAVWEQEAGWWPIFFEHYEMDNIEFSMAKCKEYVACKNAPLPWGNCRNKADDRTYVRRKEAVSLGNIFYTFLDDAGVV